jgi:hypothetical protein
MVLDTGRDSSGGLPSHQAPHDRVLTALSSTEKTQLNYYLKARAESVAIGAEPDYCVPVWPGVNRKQELSPCPHLSRTDAFVAVATTGLGLHPSGVI